MPSNQISEGQTGYFNPSVDGPVSDRTGASQGAASHKAQEYAQGDSLVLKGLGELWTQVVQGTDTVIKGNIDDTTRDAYEKTNAELFSGEAKPPEVEKGMAGAEALTAARNAGTISPSSYWMRMEVLSRGLKAKYDGHQDYIDQRMSQLTGNVPANALRRELLSQTAKLDPTQKLLDGNLGYLNDDTIANLPKGVYPSFNDLQAEIARNKTAETRQNFRKSQLELEGKTDEQRTRYATDGFRESLGHIFTTKLAPQIKDLHDNVQGLLDSGPNYSDKQLGVVSALVLQKKSEIESAIRGEALGLNGGPNYARFLDADKLNQITKPYTDVVDNLSQAILKKDTAAIELNGNLLQNMLDGSNRKLFEDDEALLRTAAIGKSGVPPQVVADIVFQDIKDGNGKILKTVDQEKKQMAQHIWAGTVVPDNLSGDLTQAHPETLTKALDKFGKGELDPQSTTLTMKMVVQTLSHPGVPVEVKARAAKRIFDDPIGFQKAFSPAERDDNGPKVPERFRAWYMLNTPAVATAMQEIRKTDPGTYDKYQSYVIEGSNALLGKTIGDMRAIVIDDANGGYKVNYDPKSHSFIGDRSGMGAASKDQMGPYYDAQVAKFNMAMKPIMSMYEAEGGNVDDKFLDTLKVLGFDKDEPTQPGVTKTLLTMARNGVLDFFEKSTGPNAHPGTVFTNRPMHLGANESFGQARDGHMIDGAQPVGPGVEAGSMRDARHSTALEGAVKEFRELWLDYKANPTEDKANRVDDLIKNIEEIKKQQGVPAPVPAVRPTSGTLSKLGGPQPLEVPSTEGPTQGKTPYGMGTDNWIQGIADYVSSASETQARSALRQLEKLMGPLTPQQQEQLLNLKDHTTGRPKPSSRGKDITF